MLMSNTRVRLFRLLLATTMALGLTIAPARPAAASAPRVAVTFQGPGAPELREAMVARLSSRCRVLPARQSERAMAGSAAVRSGVEWANIVRRLKVNAVVDGRVSPGPNWRVRLVVRNGHTGAAAGTLAWASNEPRELMADVLREGPSKILGLLARAGTPARQRARPVMAPLARNEDLVDPDPDPTVEDAPAPVTTRPTRMPSPPWMEASLGPGAIARNFTFTDNPSGAPGYRLPLAPALGGEVLLFPFMSPANAGSLASHLGVAVAAASSLGARTAGRDSGDAGHATRFATYRAGLRGRLASERAALVLGLDLGQQDFQMDVPDEAFSPAIRYRFLRPSVAARLNLDHLSVSLTAAYLGVTSTAGWSSASLFPRARASGVEGGLRVAYAVGGPLEIDGGADLRRFAFSLDARPGDPLIAGGAVDEYLVLAMRLTWRLR